MKTSKQIENEIKRLEKQRLKQLEKEHLEQLKKQYHEACENFVKYCFNGDYGKATSKIMETYERREDYQNDTAEIERKKAEAAERRRARNEAKKSAEQNQTEE